MKAINLVVGKNINEYYLNEVRERFPSTHIPDFGDFRASISEAAEMYVLSRGYIYPKEGESVKEFFEYCMYNFYLSTSRMNRMAKRIRSLETVLGVVREGKEKEVPVELQDEVEGKNKILNYLNPLNLMDIDEVKVFTDYCTDELQKRLDEGYKILAICNAKNQRRPDYILGRVKKKEKKVAGANVLDMLDNVMFTKNPTEYIGEYAK